MQWAPTFSFTITGAFSFLNTELTRLNPQLQGIAVPVGSELPLAPKVAGNLRVRYDFMLESLGADAYLTAGVTYRGRTVSGLIGNAEFMDDTLFRQSGKYSGLSIQHENGTFGHRDDSRGSSHRLVKTLASQHTLRESGRGDVQRSNGRNAR